MKVNPGDITFIRGGSIEVASPERELSCYLRGSWPKLLFVPHDYQLSVVDTSWDSRGFGCGAYEGPFVFAFLQKGNEYALDTYAAFRCPVYLEGATSPRAIILAKGLKGEDLRDQLRSLRKDNEAFGPTYEVRTVGALRGSTVGDTRRFVWCQNDHVNYFSHGYRFLDFPEYFRNFEFPFIERGDIQ